MPKPPYQLFRVDQEDGTPVVTLLVPELRSDTQIAKLEQELESFIESSGARQFVLDLSSVHYLTSSGLRVLIVLRKRLTQLGGRFTMCHVHPYVADVFRTTRLFTEKFDYHADVPAALAAMKSPAAS